MSTRFGPIVALLLFGPSAFSADEPKKVGGRVVDPSGDPVAGASVSAFWTANGLDWEQFEALGDKQPEKRWQNEGKMAPWGEFRVVTDAEGRFSIPAPEKKKTLMVYDRERRQGAVLVLDTKHPETPVEVRLAPLVRVFGVNRLSAAPGPMRWTCTYLNLPYDENDPLNRSRMAICGSFQSRFEFQVPPGRYEFSASSDDPSSSTPEGRTITITADQKDVDLGSLILKPQVGGIQALIDRAKSKGTWGGNYKQLLGKEPPPWHLTDAKGVARDAKLSDFRGKWAVLYFWGPDCSPCLGKDLPELMAFYEAQKAHRDRFEILAFCTDFSESISDIAALEKHLAAVKKAVWGGKDLPFPVLLDNTFQTYERFGLEGQGVPVYLLINPEGKLVEGSLETLAKALEGGAGH